MRRFALRTVQVLAMVVGSSVATTAAAVPRDPAAAEVLFRDGRTRAVARDWASACPKFAESMRLDPAPGTLLNLADCEEHTGKLASAWEHFRQLAEQLPPSDERQPLAVDRAAKLEKRMPRLTLALTAPAPPDTMVWRDDVELGEASFGVALPVDPGEHAVVVRAPGHDARRYTLSIVEGERRTLVVEPGPVEAPHESTKRTVGLVTGAAGIAALGVGAYFGMRALTNRDQSDRHCTNGVCSDPASVQAYDDAKTDARIADVALGVGVVGVVVGAYLVLSSTTPSTEPPPAAAPPRTATRVAISPSGVGVSW